MTKLLMYARWAIIAVLAIIVVLWISYFLDCLAKSQNHFFLENNYSLNFLRWVNRITNSALVLRIGIFDDIFYLEEFPRISIFVEVLFVILLAVVATLRKQKRKQYILKLCVSIICFVVLFDFLNATLKLFVPG